MAFDPNPNKLQKTLKLTQRGMSALGARQVLNGDVVTLASDRKLVAAAVEQAIGGGRSEQLNSRYADNRVHTAT